MTLTQQQYEAKVQLMQAAALMAAGICPPGTSEADFNKQHCRCYQYLVVNALPDETVYMSPPAIAPSISGGQGGQASGGLTQGALLTAVQKVLADPAQAATMTAGIAKLIGVAIPSTAPVANQVAEVAAGIAQLPATTPATK